MTRVLLALMMLIPCNLAQANEKVAAFYAGKSLRLTVGSSAGGGTDIVARLLARHIGRFVPGNPAVVVVNQPGGGGRHSRAAGRGQLRGRGSGAGHHGGAARRATPPARERAAAVL